MAAGVLTATVGTIVLAVLIVRVIDQPALGHGRAERAISIRRPPTSACSRAAALAAGAWLAIRDERTDAPESAYEQPPRAPRAARGLSRRGRGGPRWPAS